MKDGFRVETGGGKSKMKIKKFIFNGDGQGKFEDLVIDSDYMGDIVFLYDKEEFAIIEGRESEGATELFDNIKKIVKDYGIEIIEIER